jgi:tRNA uridine 5-carboxymethylaminomethyl modification enzyme
MHEAEQKKSTIEKAISYLAGKKVLPDKNTNIFLESLGTPGLKKTISASELLRRPQIFYKHIKDLKLAPELLPSGYERVVETMVKYEGFIRNQEINIKKMRDIENIKLPEGIDFSKIPGLSIEIIQKLKQIKPVSLGQASRISGVTPAAVMILMVYLRKR